MHKSIYYHFYCVNNIEFYWKSDVPQPLEIFVAFDIWLIPVFCHRKDDAYIFFIEYFALSCFCNISKAVRYLASFGYMRFVDIERDKEGIALCWMRVSLFFYLSLCVADNSIWKVVWIILGSRTTRILSGLNNDFI